jgi:hypothetical protein
LLSIHNVTKFQKDSIAIIQLEHRIPYHQKYSLTEEYFVSNLTTPIGRKILAETYKNVLLLSPMITRSFYDDQTPSAYMWIRLYGTTANFPFGISPLNTYIEDAMISGMYFEAISLLNRMSTRKVIQETVQKI